jgi:DnaK suppressor protein
MAHLLLPHNVKDHRRFNRNERDYRPAPFLKGKAMTQTDLDGYRQQLLNLELRLADEVHTVADQALRETGGEPSGSLSNAPMHLADLASDNFEQETAISLLENEEQVLRQIRDAILRIDQGKYGRCQVCSKEIPVQRLEAIPFTPYCVECAERIRGNTATDAARGNL